MKKPVIGISAANIFNDKMYSQRITYPQAVEGQGGTPVLLPCMPTTENVAEVVSHIDGLMVPGGADVDPSFYNAERKEWCGTASFTDDAYDIALIKEAMKQHKPILAICRGMQILNACEGGTLYQDIPTEFSKEIYHSMLEGGVENHHEADIEPGSKLAAIIGTHLTVNTSHHQAVKDVAPGYRIVGTAPDGSKEAMENADGSVICVQWHPERMQDTEEMRNLVRDFINRCR